MTPTANSLLRVQLSFYEIRLCYDTCNAMDNQRSIQPTPTIFSCKSCTTDVVITVEKVRPPNAGRRSRAPNMFWPHIWWLNQAVERSVDCMSVDYMLR
jgi:hypothetical protein